MRNTCHKVARPLTLVLLAGLCMGNRSSCDGNPPSLTCDPLEVDLFPGQCVEFSNPCADGWVRLDGFRLCDPPNGFSVRSRRNPRSRSICTTQQGPGQGDYAIEYFYVAPSDSGEGLIFAHVLAEGLSLSASVDPAVIAVGESAQLHAEVTGGKPPYNYSWFPAGSLDDASIQNPIASPVNPTIYTVTVTDSVGSVVSDSVTLIVGFEVQVSALPNSIALGGSAMLMAEVRGGTPPYTYAWSPGDSLDDPTIAAPTATPTRTTTYTIRASDAFAAEALGAATVAVTRDDCVGIGGNVSIMSAADLAVFREPADAACFAVLGELRILDSNLTDLTGLEKVAAAGSLLIDNNANLLNVQGLGNLGSPGPGGQFDLTNDITIRDNLVLTSLAGLEGLTFILRQLVLDNNPLLVDLNGLAGLTEVSADFNIVFNDALTNLAGLESLGAIGGSLSITGNDGLMTLTGLEYVTSLGRDLEINNNDQLTSVAALLNLESVSTATFSSIVIQDNPSLPTSEAEALRDHFVALGFVGSVTISGNAP